MSNKRRSVDDEIDHVLSGLETMSITSQEYGVAVKNLEVLTKAKSNVICWRISPDVIISAITNIVGIVLVLNYEQVHVVTSRALNFILRGRL